MSTRRSRADLMVLSVVIVAGCALLAVWAATTGAWSRAFEVAVGAGSALLVLLLLFRLLNTSRPPSAKRRSRVARPSHRS